jgi:hypothetical protein
MTSGTNRATWKVSVKRKDVDKAFASVAGGPISGLKIVARTESRRVKKVELQSGKKRKTITGADFRRLLGWSVVWSTQIDSIILTKTELVVAGRGSGHGVGSMKLTSLRWLTRKHRQTSRTNDAEESDAQADDDGDPVDRPDWPLGAGSDAGTCPEGPGRR